MIDDGCWFALISLRHDLRIDLRFFFEWILDPITGIFLRKQIPNKVITEAINGTTL